VIPVWRPICATGAAGFLTRLPGGPTAPQPSGSAAAKQDFSERSAVNVVAGRAVSRAYNPAETA